MKTMIKFLAPAAVALFAFNAQAADQISTGGEAYRGYEVAGDKVDASQEVAATERVNTGGATYFGQTNELKVIANPDRKSWLSERQLEVLYIG